jgi:predicted secreted protein
MHSKIRKVSCGGLPPVVVVMMALLSAAGSARAENGNGQGFEFLRGDLNGVKIERLFEVDGNRIVALAVDTVAVIELDANITTGYNWQIVAPTDARLRILGKHYLHPSSKLLGAPGKTRIFVVGEAKGPAELELQYKRPFMKTFEDRKVFHFRSMGKFQGEVELEPEEAYVPLESSTRGDPESDLPDEFNWCDDDGCTQIKNQGQCGSCWAFATIGPLEQLINIKDAVEEDLSEQYLVSCDNDAWGCNGGDVAFDYLIDKTDDGGDAGVPLEEVFPYEAANVACAGPYEKAYRGNAWGYVGSTVEEIKRAIYDHGPLYTGVCANDAMSYYTEGIFEEGCTQSNHGVVLVGWNETEGYWHMRNSWGPYWGENGYMRIGYGVSRIGEGSAWIDYDSSRGYSVDPRTPKEFVGPHCGPYVPESFVYILSNNNKEEAIKFQIDVDSDWLMAAPASGTLGIGESVEVEFTLSEDAIAFPVGAYNAKAEFKNLTNGLGETTRAISMASEGGELVYSWNLDEDPGWTAEGQWAFGKPTGGGGAGESAGGWSMSFGSPDPTSGYTGDNVYGVNLNGNYTPNTGEQNLTTTAIDCSDLTGITLRFWRWLGVEQSVYDHAYIRISTDLQTWQEVWQNSESLSDSEWKRASYDISQYADGQPTVYIRWVMGTTDQGLEACGWNIDDVEIWQAKEEEECMIEEEDAGADTDTDTDTDTATETDTATDTGTDTGGDTASDGGGDDGCGCGQAGSRFGSFGLLQAVFDLLAD